MKVFFVTLNFSKIDEFACQGQRSLPKTLNFLLDLLNFEKVWLWDSCGFMRYVQFPTFSGDFGFLRLVQVERDPEDADVDECSFLYQ